MRCMKVRRVNMRGKRGGEGGRRCHGLEMWRMKMRRVKMLRESAVPPCARAGVVLRDGHLEELVGSPGLGLLRNLCDLPGPLTVGQLSANAAQHIDALSGLGS